MVRAHPLDRERPAVLAGLARAQRASEAREPLLGQLELLRGRPRSSSRPRCPCRGSRALRAGGRPPTSPAATTCGRGSRGSPRRRRGRAPRAAAAPRARASDSPRTAPRPAPAGGQSRAQARRRRSPPRARARARRPSCCRIPLPPVYEAVPKPLRGGQRDRPELATGTRAEPEPPATRSSGRARRRRGRCIRPSPPSSGRRPASVPASSRGRTSCSVRARRCRPQARP